MGLLRLFFETMYCKELGMGKKNVRKSIHTFLHLFVVSWGWWGPGGGGGRGVEKKKMRLELQNSNLSATVDT